MPKHIINKFILITAFTIIAAQSLAHVPYLEHNDFSTKQPFKVEYSIEQSLAIYAWLDNKNINSLEDIDVFVFNGLFILIVLIKLIPPFINFTFKIV